MTRPWTWTLGLAAAFVAVIALAFMLLAPEPLPDKVEPEPEPVDSGRVMDLEHLTEADLRFLEDTLREGTPAAQISAARALVASGDARGAPMLFAKTLQAPGDDLLFCLAATEILRMQRHDTAVRTLIVAKESGVSSACATEVNQRLALLARDQRALVLLAEAPEPAVRAWVSYKLDLGEPTTTEAITALALDPETEVRRAAWLAIAGHGERLDAPMLLTWVDQEPDPQLRARIEEVVQTW